MSMDILWDCMNVANRIGKQIESSESLIPKHQQQTSGISIVSDLQELVTTVNSVKTTLVPFVTNSKKSKGVSEMPSFEICLKGIKLTLNDLHNYFKDLEKEFSIYTWKTQKVKLYQLDFLLKQKLDQFSALFNFEEGKDKKSKDKGNLNLHIEDKEARDFWIKSFGEVTLIVPWATFFQTLETVLNLSLKEDEESLKMFLDFTKIDHVSSFAYGVFLKWFGPFKQAVSRALEAIHGGLLCGFVPAVEANLLLEGKREGTFLIRCSKTQPGSFAVTFVDQSLKVKHCLLYSVTPTGLTLKNPPTVYQSLKEFSDAHTNKLKHPLGNHYTFKNRKQGFDYGKESNSNASAIKTSETSIPLNGSANNTIPVDPKDKPFAENNICVVCMDAPFQTVFLECGHLACCLNCSGKLKNCPICRNVISRTIPIFRAS
jgi:hypothetical protein